MVMEATRAFEKFEFLNDSRQQRSSSVQCGPELAIIVPTFNERGNVEHLIHLVDAAMGDVAWEILFVDDDSADGTVEVLRDLAQHDHRIRLIHRVGRRGLSSACIEGIQATSAPYVAVMDADLQHDETLLPKMLDTLKRTGCDVVIGSRYVDGGGVGGWDERRVGMSAIATKLGRLLLRVDVADPMSGFFMLPRPVFETALRRLSAIGFKILIDILISSPTPLSVRELPFQFRERNAGESKLDSKVIKDYLLLLADKLIGHIVPIRFVLFSLVGLVGLGAHLVILWASLHLSFPFATAQSVATGLSMVGNFALNNWLTYSDRRLTGWHFFVGLLSFCLVCSVGGVANIGIASFLFGEEKSSWWIAGIAGAAMSTVWNYAVSSFFTWRRK